jgi:hypothetical protein
VRISVIRSGCETENTATRLNMTSDEPNTAPVATPTPAPAEKAVQHKAREVVAPSQK